MSYQKMSNEQLLHARVVELEAEVNRLRQRLYRHEKALWLYVDKCFQYHIQPEGLTQTEAVCEVLEEADREMKGEQG